MKITDIHIDGFGVWHDLTLSRLSPEITIFYGPNEAGKTTLMQFLRSVLYGVSPKRRKKYLPPLAGGQPGGWLNLLTDDGPIEVSRYADRGPDDLGKVTITTADGDVQGDRLLREALEHVDEPTYSNIYAVGLQEVQELGSLSGTAAAQWLYRLTSGLDRVSLYDVIHLLGSSRLRLLNGQDEPSEIRTLVARREQLHAELNELVAKGRRWSQSAVKLRELADEVDRLQAELKQVENRVRRIDIGVGLKPLWAKREKITDQLLGFGGLQSLEQGTLQALTELNDKIENHERERDILRGQRHQLRDEANSLGINDQLVGNRCRIEGLGEQQDWLQSLGRQAETFTDEIGHLEARLESENERLSQQWTGAGKMPPAITPEVLDQLRPQSKAMASADELVESARSVLEQRRSGEHQFRSQIDSAMTNGDKLGLPKDVAKSTDLVASLRRRLQVEQRLDQSRRHASDLQQQSQDLVEEQIIPMGLFSWLLGIFVLGFVMLAVWWMLPGTMFGQYGGWIAAMGIGGSLFAWLFKYFAEDSAADRFEACQKQMESVTGQIDQAKDDMKQLDRELPMTEGSVVLRLQHAERHLEELQRMLPVETKRREAAGEITSAERRFELAVEKQAEAKSNWQSKLRAVGLPDDIRPADLETMAGQYEQLSILEQRVENRREELARRQRELSLVTKRIRDLAQETGLQLENSSSQEQFDHLLAEYRAQKRQVAQREKLKDRAAELKLEEGRHARAAIGLTRRREAIFQKSGVEDEHGLRLLADRLQEAEKLRKRQEGVSREISAAIGSHGSEQDFSQMLAPEQAGRLELEREKLATQIEILQQELKTALERRGALIEQQRALAGDHSLAQKQMEIDEVEEQTRLAIRSWRERAVVGRMLERIRDDYEAHRQPETLQEASKYMSQLTDGKYKRVWTPLANDILLVETAEGESLPVDVLSRGTREQLFVSVRLALVAAFARRGIHLPMILDDVMVNFDATRSKTAAQVLCDFAKEGHQLLIFTCHEHVWRMFKQIKVDTRRLPNRLGEPIDEIVEEVPEEVIEVPTVVEPDPVILEVMPEPELVEVVEIAEPEPLPLPDYQYDENQVEAAEVEIREYEYELAGASHETTPKQSATEVEYWWTDTATS